MDPTQATRIEDLFAMERASFNKPYTEDYSIPYSNNKLSPEQWEISNEMSNYGSTLTSSLAACGVLGCLGCIGATCYSMGKKAAYNSQPGNTRENPIVIIDDLDWIKEEEE